MPTLLELEDSAKVLGLQEDTGAVDFESSALELGLLPDTGQSRLSTAGSQLGRGFGSAILDAVQQAGETASRFSPANLATEAALRLGGADSAAIQKAEASLPPILAETPGTTAAKAGTAKLESALPVNPAYQQEFWASQVPQAVGQAAGIVLPAIATGGSSGAAWLPRIQGMLLGMKQGYAEADRQGVSDPIQRDALALGYGTAEAGVEAMGGVGTADLGKRLLGEVAKRGGETFLQKLLGRAAGRFVGTAGVEALEEPITGELQDIAANVFGGGSGKAPPSFDLTDPEVLKRRGTEAALGLIASAPVAGVDAYMSSRPVPPPPLPPPPPDLQTGPPVPPPAQPPPLSTGPAAPPPTPAPQVANPLAPTPPELAATLDADLAASLGQKPSIPANPPQINSEGGIPAPLSPPSEATKAAPSAPSDTKNTLPVAPVELPTGGVAEVPVVLPGPNGLEPNLAPLTYAAVQQAAEATPQSTEATVPRGTSEPPTPTPDAPVQAVQQTSLPAEPEGRVVRGEETKAGPGNRVLSPAPSQAERPVDVPPTPAPAPPSPSPAPAAVQTGTAIPAGTGTIPPRGSETAAPVQAEVANAPVIAMAKAHGVDVNSKWWGNPANVQQVADAVAAKDVTRLPVRPRLVAEDLIAGKTPETYAQEQARLDALARKQDRELLAKERQDDRKGKSDYRDAKVEEEGRTDETDALLAEQVQRDEGTDEAEELQYSATGSSRPSGLNASHVEKVRRELSATKHGQWVLDRVEFMETPTQAANALGVTEDEIGMNDGVHQPSSLRSIVILSNVDPKGNETPAQALRRVAVHEAVGHGGFQELLRIFPETEAELVPIMEEVRKQGWTYTDKDGNTRSLIQQYPHFNPATAETLEEKARREQALFTEWFPRAIENYSVNELAAGKAPTLVQRAWDAFVRFIAKLLGRPKGPDVQQFAFDLAKRIFQTRTLMEGPNTQTGGQVISSAAEGWVRPEVPVSFDWDQYEGVDESLKQAALDEAWASFRAAGLNNGMTKAEVEADWAKELQDADSPTLHGGIQDAKQARKASVDWVPYDVQHDYPQEPDPGLQRSAPVAKPRIQAGAGMAWSMPELVHTGKEWTLAGKPVGREGNVDVSGLKSIGQLKDAEIDLYRSLVPDAFTGSKVNLPKLEEGLRKNGPVVEVKKMGEGSVTPEQREFSQMIHWMDTLSGEERAILSAYRAEGRPLNSDSGFPFGLKLSDDFVKNGNRLIELDRSPTRDVLSEQPHYAFVAPKAEKDMPGYVEGLVRVPTKELSGPSSGSERHDDIERGVLYSGPHFGSEDTNVVSFFRGYEDVLPDGRKVFHVIEVQSDWAQRAREEAKKNVEMGVATDKYRNAPDHPLLSAYESLALKAAIKHAQEIGADAIALSDAETAMMSEGHDIHISPRPDWSLWNTKTGEFEDAFTTEMEARSELEANIKEVGPEFVLVPPNQIPPNRFEKGMRLHYDQTLPKELKRLTGGEGEVVDFGVHAKAKEKVWVSEQRGTSEIQTVGRGSLRGSPVFKDAQGKPKSNITARVYSLSNLQDQPYYRRNAELLASAPQSTEDIVRNEKDLRSLNGKNRGIFQSIADMLAKKGARTPSGLVKGRSDMNVLQRILHNVISNPVDEAKRVHPVMGAAMEHIDYRSAQLAKEYESLHDPAWKLVFSKLTDEQDKNLRIAYLQGDVPKQHAILRDAGLDPAVYEQEIENFKQDYAKLKKAGIKLNEIKRYLPTGLKAGAYPKLVNILTKHGLISDVSRVLGKDVKDLPSMNEFEAGEKIQGAIRQIFNPPKGGHAKSRTGIALEQNVMEEIAPLYERFDNNIRQYGVQASDAIVRAEMFGPDAIDSFGEFMQGQRPPIQAIAESSPVGAIIERLRREGELDAHDLLRLKELFNHRLGYQADAPLARWLKSGNMALAMGNPFSAIKQPLGELVKNLWGNGTIPTLIGIKRALKGEGLRVQRDLNISPDYQIAQGNDPIKKYNDIVAKMSGFKKMDIFPAEAIGNAYLEKLKRMPEKERLEELSTIKDFFSGTDKDVSVQEVSGKIMRDDFHDPDVWRVAWHGITKLRPTGIGTQPIFLVKNNASLNRIAGNLKGWGFRQLNQLKEGIYDNMRSGDPDKVKEGLGQLTVLVSGLAMAGATGDALVDWLLGRDVKFNEKVEDNLLKLALGSRYQLNQLVGNKPSPKDAVLNYMSTPVISFVDSAFGDAVKAIKDDEKGFMEIALKDRQLARAVPLGIGIAAHDWLGEGGREDRAKAVDNRVTGNVQKITDEYSRLRELGEVKRNASPLMRERWKRLSDFQHLKSYHIGRAKAAAEMGDYQEADAHLQVLNRIADQPGTWSTRASAIPKDWRLKL